MSSVLQYAGNSAAQTGSYSRRKIRRHSASSRGMVVQQSRHTTRRCIQRQDQRMDVFPTVKDALKHSSGVDYAEQEKRGLSNVVGIKNAIGLSALFYAGVIAAVVAVI